MGTSPETAAFVGERLGRGFELRKMFGEYAVYHAGKVVALVCDDRVFVKVHEGTKALADHEQAPPYPGAKPHYLIEEGELGEPAFRQMLADLAKALPAPKKKPAKR